MAKVHKRNNADGGIVGNQGYAFIILKPWSSSLLDEQALVKLDEPESKSVYIAWETPVAEFSELVREDPPPVYNTYAINLCERTLQPGLYSLPIKVRSPSSMPPLSDQLFIIHNYKFKERFGREF